MLRTIFKGKLIYLVMSLLLLIVFHPLLEGGIVKLIIWNALLSIVCFFGIHAVSFIRDEFVIALIIGGSWFLTTWINLFYSSYILGIISIVLLILFYIYTSAVLLIFVLSSNKVNREMLSGAVAAYLLIGGIFNMTFVLLETVQPGSFYINPALNVDGLINWSDFLYYSYTTLTTLGPGDIIPITSFARSFTILESIMGVMFLGLIMSRLVGLYIRQKRI